MPGSPACPELLARLVWAALTCALIALETSVRSRSIYRPFANDLGIYGLSSIILVYSV